jgi:hydroxyacylglutathione hydrolase
LRGAPFLSDRPKIPRLQFSEFKVLVQEGATILDVRPAALFADAHAVGSLNIGVASPSFPVWSGFLLNSELPILLVVADEGEVELAKLQLARIGFDHIAGFIVAEDLEETVHSNRLGVPDLRGAASDPDCAIIVDVRSTQEYDQEHLEGTINIPLPSLLRRAGEFSRDTPLALLCASGYRSSIATSFLESEGFTRASNVMGGMDAIDLNCGDDLLWPRSSLPPLFHCCPK